MKYKNLVFLGTSHIAKQSLNEVKKCIEEEKPDVIALELDKKRMQALMTKVPERINLRNIKHIGLKGFLFSAFGAWAERKLGKLVGIKPGSEMKQAIKIAKNEKITIALIDQDIEITLRRLSNSITWKEKRNFFVDIAESLFARKKEIEFDLTTVPDKKIIKKLMEKLKLRYPNVYNVLIDERNIVIARNIKGLMNSSPNKKILVILGAGHIDDVLELIKHGEETGIRFSFSVGQNQYL